MRYRSVDEILEEIVSKHPYDLTNHELSWLCLNVFFGEENHLGIYCIKAIPMCILQLYEDYNSPYLKEITDKEEFLRYYSKKIHLASPKLFGLQRIDPKSGNAPKYMKEMLLESGLCPYKNKSFGLYSYSVEMNRYILEQRFKNGCSAPRCAICHGAALKRRVKTYLEVAAMFYSINPIETLKTIKMLSNNYPKYWDDDVIREEFVKQINSQAGLPKDITKDDVGEILEEIAEELE